MKRIITTVISIDNDDDDERKNSDARNFGHSTNSGMFRVVCSDKKKTERVVIGISYKKFGNVKLNIWDLKYSSTSMAIN